MRKVFLEDLPRWGKPTSRNCGKEGTINWTKCIGYEVGFVYDEIEGKIKIKDYDKKSHNLYVTYINEDIYKTTTSDFINGSIGVIVGKFHLSHKYSIGEIVQKDTCPFEIIDQTRITNTKKGVGKRGYTVKCNTCGSVHKDVNESKLGMYGRVYKCRVCNDGVPYPEKLLHNILKQLNVEFKAQKKFKWSENKVYDFYIPSPYNIIIETHGEQHYKDKSGWNIKYKDQKKNDEIKKGLAISNNIEHYIEIDCRKSELDFIKENILNSKVSELFDLSNIDWMECNNNATSSLAKVACDLWNSGIRNTPTIAEMIGKTKQSVITYLKRFAEIGLCDYNPKEEQRKGNKATELKRRKPIICTDNGIVFDSACKCSEVSEEIFGVKLTQTCISAVIRGERNHHKGYHFMFYKDYLAQQQSAQ